jgi:hypothetical protein
VDEVVVVVHYDAGRTVRTVRLSNALIRAFLNAEIRAEDFKRAEYLLRLAEPGVRAPQTHGTEVAVLARWWEDAVVVAPHAPSTRWIAREAHHGRAFFVAAPRNTAWLAFAETLAYFHEHTGAVSAQVDTQAVPSPSAKYRLEFLSTRPPSAEPTAITGPQREEPAAGSDDEGTEALWAATDEAWSRCTDELAELRAALKQLQDTLDRRSSGAVGGQ